MAQLYFYYSAMNAGKTTALLQSSYNYRERGMHTLLYTARINIDVNIRNDKYARIQSRIGLAAIAKVFDNKTNLFNQVMSIHKASTIHCVFIDECHFLTQRQVAELTEIVDILNIPVLCYGLRTDFKAELFIGSLWLLAWADKLVELKTICFCGCKANRVLRVDEQGQIVIDGKQVMFGGNNYYISVCRRHFIEQWKSGTFLSKEKRIMFNVKN